LILLVCMPGTGIAAGTHVYDLHKGRVSIHVALVGRVGMVRALSRSPGENPAVRVHVTGAFPPIDVVATPAYGFASNTGREVFVTFVTSYRGSGDAQASHPVFQGVPIRPNSRELTGYAELALPIGEHAALALTVRIRRPGYADVSLRDERHPEQNLIAQ